MTWYEFQGAPTRYVIDRNVYADVANATTSTCCICYPRIKPKLSLILSLYVNILEKLLICSLVIKANRLKVSLKCSTMINCRQGIRPRFISLIVFWKTWKTFTFKCPIQRCQSSNASYFFQDYAKLATTVPYTLMKFIWYKFPSYNTIAIISSSEDLTMHSFRLNYTLNIFDKILLTESKCVCNFNIWNTFLMQIILTLSFICTSITKDFIFIILMTLSSPKWTLSGTNYLVCIKYHPMRSHMFRCYRIHDPLTWMRSILHYGCMIIIIFDVVCILFCLCFFLFCGKNTQCSSFCYNSSTFWCLCVKIYCFLYLHTIPLWHHHSWCLPSSWPSHA